mmetsp:Transcript_57093/g.146939  ORF Transcript_57093/g.146939 Transcript_57093/m.146939 type:complete len:182 (-) Transcript_57093:214-759(-)
MARQTSRGRRCLQLLALGVASLASWSRRQPGAAFIPSGRAAAPSALLAAGFAAPALADGEEGLGGVIAPEQIPEGMTQGMQGGMSGDMAGLWGSWGAGREMVEARSPDSTYDFPIIGVLIVGSIAAAFLSQLPDQDVDVEGVRAKGKPEWVLKEEAENAAREAEQKRLAEKMDAGEGGFSP